MVHSAGRALTYFLDCSVVGSNPTQDFRVVLSAVDSYHQGMQGIYNTVEPPIMDTLKSGQPPYNGHTARPLPIYCPYISTSE